MEIFDLPSWLKIVPFQNKALLEDLQQVGIFAGGCIATPTQCGDLDLFLPNGWDQFLQVMSILSKHVCQTSERCMISPYIPEKQTLHDGSICLVEVKIVGENVPLQCIFTEATSALELIKGFDMDYVQAAIHQHQFITTDAYLAVSKTKVVSQLCLPLSHDRFEKAWTKGYSVPMLLAHAPGDWMTEWVDIPMEEPKLCPIAATKDDMVVHVKDLLLTKIQWRKTFHRKGKHDIDYYHFVLGQDVYMPFITIQGVVTSRQVHNDTIYFWVQELGEKVTFRCKPSTIPPRDVILENLVVGNPVKVLVECSIGYAGQVRLEVHSVLDVQNTNILPIPMDPSFLSQLQQVVHEKCTRVQDWEVGWKPKVDYGQDLEWVQERIKVLESADGDKMQRIASMAYKALIYYAPTKECHKAAEQFAYDVRKHLGSDKVQQDLGSDMLSRFAGGGELRKDVSTVEKVIIFIEDWLQRGQPEPGVCPEGGCAVS